jgi:hypothetical protein
MNETVEYKTSPREMDIDAIINQRAIAVRGENHEARPLEPKPFEDAEFTSEEIMQVQAFSRALAIDRAVGKLPQRWIYTGVMPTRENISKEFYQAHEDNRPAVEVSVFEA